jgi:hypothetical protein
MKKTSKKKTLSQQLKTKKLLKDIFYQIYLALLIALSLNLVQWVVELILYGDASPETQLTGFLIIPGYIIVAVLTFESRKALEKLQQRIRLYRIKRKAS